MKIVYISDSIIPSKSANSIHVIKMSSALSKLGNEVTLIAKKGVPSSPLDSNIYEAYNVPKSFQILLLKQSRNRVEHFLYALKAVLKAVFLKSEIIYTRDFTSAILSYLIKRTFILELHSPISTGAIKKIIFKYVSKSKYCAQVIIITKSLADETTNKFPYIASKITISPDAADPIPRSLKIKNHAKISSKIHIGYSGHLYKGKGFELIEKIAPKCPWATFDIYGGQRADLKKLKSRGISENITLHGFLQQKDLTSRILQCDFLLLPNQVVVLSESGKDIAKWTSPMKLFEYMAAGKPIIASDLPVLKEILRDGENAMLCPPDKPEEWVKTLESLAKDPKKSTELGQQALLDFSQNYTWEIRAKRILNSI